LADRPEHGRRRHCHLTPDGLPDIAELHGVDLTPDIIVALEQKMEMKKNYAGTLSNNILATL